MKPGNNIPRIVPEQPQINEQRQVDNSAYTTAVVKCLTAIKVFKDAGIKNVNSFDSLKVKEKIDDDYEVSLDGAKSAYLSLLNYDASDELVHTIGRHLQIYCKIEDGK